MPSIIAKSDPQIPDSRGVRRTQSGPGKGSGSLGSSFNGPTAAPLPGAKRAR